MREARERRPHLSIEDIVRLRDNAEHTLYDLVTSSGIYGSSDMGWKGAYHSWFGRDSAITADFLCQAVNLGGDRTLANTARKALLAFSAWQGKADDVETGEERGRFPHEIRNSFNEADRIQHAKGTNVKPWYIDPKDGLLKNWDSIDSTALWIATTIRLHESLNHPLGLETLEALRLGLEWILRNIRRFNGLMGFIGADETKGRIYSGLHNQGWKDTYQIYQNPDGSLAKHPIKDVLVNAEGWAALRLGAEAFALVDPEFSSELREEAQRLKQLFNDAHKGFLLQDGKYYAQAVDGDGRQLTQIAADVAMCLWANDSKECIISTSTIGSIVEEVTSKRLFNPEAGIRNYAVGTEFFQGIRYHGSPDTYWPFVSGLIASGLDHFSYKEQAADVIKAYLQAVLKLGSNIEMFIETPDGQLVAWHHPKIGQESVAEQAWSAAAVYFGSLYLLKNNKVD